METFSSIPIHEILSLQLFAVVNLMMGVSQLEKFGVNLKRRCMKWGFFTLLLLLFLFGFDQEALSMLYNCNLKSIPTNEWDYSCVYATNTGI